MKSLIIVYPDKRFVERDPEREFGHPIRLDAIERYWTHTCPIISPMEFWRRMGLVNKILDEYRQTDHTVYWVVFGKQEQPVIPERESIHHLYKVKPNDKVVSAGISYMQHTRNMEYANERDVLSKLTLGEETVLGGFHENDCVTRFADEVNTFGVKSRIDSLLTEHGLLWITRTFEQDLSRYLIDRGDMTPDECSPEEEKLIEVDNRLTAEDLRIHYPKN